MMKFADSEISWKGSSLSHLLYFAEKMRELMKAALSIIDTYNYKNEVILKKQDDDPVWSLKQYEHYCPSPVRHSPWHFFPRYLSKKEFLDPYNALEKFTHYQTFSKWKYTLKELLHHALSRTGITELNGSTGILHTYILLHKLIEGSHLLAIRMDAEQPKPNNLKWKNKNQEEQSSPANQ
jgi:hypothetical protein